MTDRSEIHAATALTRYVKQMTGAKLPVLREGERNATGSGVILIGKPATHRSIKRLVATGAVAHGAEVTGDDGFVIKTLNNHQPPTLVISGGRDRGTLFGVYELLHRYCRVGFF